MPFSWSSTYFLKPRDAVRTRLGPRVRYSFRDPLGIAMGESNTGTTKSVYSAPSVDGQSCVSSRGVADLFSHTVLVVSSVVSLKWATPIKLFKLVVAVPQMQKIVFRHVSSVSKCRLFSSLRQWWTNFPPTECTRLLRER